MGCGEERKKRRKKDLKGKKDLKEKKEKKEKKKKKKKRKKEEKDEKGNKYLFNEKTRFFLFGSSESEQLFRSSPTRADYQLVPPLRKTEN